MGKSFGYAGFGKFSFKANALEGSVKVDAGLLFRRDKGLSGYSIKGPTIDLFSASIKTKPNGKLEDVNYYFAGKGGVLKGSVFGGKFESLKGDVSAGMTWSVGDRGLTKSTDTYVTFGAPFTQVSVNNITNKGISIHAGFQEDFGSSVNWLAFGLGYSVAFKTQIHASWEF